MRRDGASDYCLPVTGWDNVADIVKFVRDSGTEPGMKPLIVNGPHRALRGNRPLQLLLAGQAFSSLADWLLAVILTVLVFNLGHMATSVSLLTLARLAPYALVLPISGLVLDRMDRRTLMATLGVGRAVCIAGLLVVNARGGLPLIYPLVFASSSFSSLLRPTINATLPAFVSGDDNVAANGLVSQVDGLAHIIGPAIAGAFILIHAPEFALLVTTLAFLASGLSFFLTRSVPNTLRVSSHANLNPAEILAGFRFVLRENEGVLFALGTTAAGLALLAGAFYVLAIELSTRTFSLGNQGVGWLDGLYGVGGLAGAWVVGWLVRGRKLAHVFTAAAAVNSLGVIMLALSPAGIAPFVCLAVLGATGVVIQVTGTTILQSATPTEMLGRAFTAFEAALVVATLTGAVIAGPLVRLVGVRETTAAIGILGALLLLVSLPWLRSLEDVLGVRIFLRAVPLLSDLPRPLLDDLAPRFESESVAQGAAIVREEERGDKLYIIKSGAVDVSVKGRWLRRIGPQGYFGEVALLRNVPRTASVSACAPTDLYSLDRQAFQQLLRLAGQVESRLDREVERYVLPATALPQSPLR